MSRADAAIKLQALRDKDPIALSAARIAIPQLGDRYTARECDTWIQTRIDALIAAVVSTNTDVETESLRVRNTMTGTDRDKADAIRSGDNTDLTVTDPDVYDDLCALVLMELVKR